jgi:hypothetical protein
MTEILIIVAVVVLLGLIIGFGFIAPRYRRGSMEQPSKRRAPVDDRVVPAEEAARNALIEAEVAADLETFIPAEAHVAEVVEVETVSPEVVEVDEPQISTERPRFRDRLGKLVPRYRERWVRSLVVPRSTLRLGTNSKKHSSLPTSALPQPRIFSIICGLESKLTDFRMAKNCLVH